jgi:APA family basic amino acid/polyamine antiporter
MTGCLNGWTLLSAQTPYAAAQDGLFPAAFARRRRGVPTVGVAVTVVLASLLTVYNYTSGSAKVFQVLVLITTFTATVPYLLATAAQLFHLVAGRRDMVDRGRLVRDAVIASVAAAFSLWLVAGAGYAAVYQGVLFLFAGVLVYAVMAARRQGAAPSDGEPSARPGTA